MRRASVPRKRHRRGHCNRVPAQPVRAAKTGKIDDELRLRYHRPAVRTAVPRRGLSEGSDVTQSLAKNRAPRGGAAPCPPPARALRSRPHATRPRRPDPGARRRTRLRQHRPDVRNSRTAARVVPKGAMSPRVWQKTTRHEPARLRAPETPSAGTPRSRSHATRPRRADRKVDDELRLQRHRPAVRTAVPRRGPSEGSEVAQSMAKRPRATTRRGSVTRKRHQRGHCNRVPAQPVRAAQIGEVDDELRLRHHRPRLP